MGMANWSEILYSSRADFTALSTFTSEASLLAGGVNCQPCIKPETWDTLAYGRRLKIKANGVVGSTGAPTYIFQCRLSSTVGDSTLSGASIGVSPTITTQSGVTNQWWELLLDITCATPGQGANETTLICTGSVRSPGGFAAPYEYSLAPTTPPTATWTAATIASAVAQYLNISVTCGTSNGSNAVTLKNLVVLLDAA